MPFDCLPPRTSSLTSVLQTLGIVPVPHEVLRAHKAAELRKHPGSFWYHHQIAALILPALGFLGSCIGIIIGAISTLVMSIKGTGHETIVSAAILCVSTLVLIAIVKSGTVIDGVRVKSPARWTEFKSDLSNVPPALATIATRITALVPATMVIGILRQEQVLLDPYLLLRYRGEEIVIGIWDGDQVLHQATSAP